MITRMNMMTMSTRTPAGTAISTGNGSGKVLLGPLVAVVEV